MKRLRALLALSPLLTPAAPAFGADTPDFMAAVDAYGQQQYQRCADILTGLQQEAIPFPANGELLQAECLAAAGRIDAAAQFLDAQLAYGRIDLDDLRNKDRPGLNALRESPQWPALLQKAERLAADRAAKMDQPLRKELLERLDKDQQLEHAVIDSGKTSETAWQELKVGPLMADNTAWLKRVVADKGWPGFSRVGIDGGNAAFIIVQHSDADPSFQAQMLPLLEAAVARHEADPSNLALLTDRVLAAQGKPQRYGTQFQNDADGSMSPKPVEDEPGLDARRRRMGLPTMNEYKQMLSETYHKPVK